MSRRKEPDYVSGAPGRYEVSPPIVHPPFCVCAICPRHRDEEDWSRSIVIRTRRRSPSPTSRIESAVFARQLKADLEESLIEAVREAEEQKRARAGAVTFGTVCDAYRQHLLDAGKRLDRARYIINNIELLIGRETDAAAVGWAEYQELLAEVAQLSAQTRRHYGSTLLVMLNFAVEHRIMKGPHALGRVPLPVVRPSGLPVTWTKEELGVILGPAMDEYEREQARWNAMAPERSAKGSLVAESHVPLRGLCYVAYFTLMRPKNNLGLTWEEVTIDPRGENGVFRLVNHKNASKGITAEGPLAAQLVRYLRAVRPSDARGLIHPNPVTGRPYVEIRKQWKRLVKIASRLLGYELTDRKADFFTFRHTGASHLAEKLGHNPMPLVKMMGDTSVETVRKHYCNLDLTFMQKLVDGWDLPLPSIHVDDAEESVS
jgi:integrase